MLLSKAFPFCKAGSFACSPVLEEPAPEQVGSPPVLLAYPASDASITPCWIPQPVSEDPVLAGVQPPTGPPHITRAVEVVPPPCSGHPHPIQGIYLNPCRPCPCSRQLIALMQGFSSELPSIKGLNLEQLSAFMLPGCETRKAMTLKHVKQLPCRQQSQLISSSLWKNATVLMNCRCISIRPLLKWVRFSKDPY